MIELQLLDGFEVRRDGAVVTLTQSARRLVAFLALHDRPLHRSYVAGSLWVESPEEQANASLRSTLRRLDRHDRLLIDADGNLVRLAAEVMVDLHELHGQARAVLRDGRATAEILRGLCLAGELLPGWYDEWVVIERERFRQLRLHALDSLCEMLTAVGRYAAAIEAGRAAVAAEPLRETGHRLLIRAYLAGGNRREAIRRYRLFRDLLEAELHLAPSAQLAELVAPLPVG
ncbi:MAG: AfsR/SARP family transcriptional regulator [Gaiellaceae bacterium]